MLSIITFPLFFYLIYIDQESGYIRKTNWLIIYPIIFLVLFLFDYQKFALFWIFLSNFGLTLILFVTFLVVIKAFGGADILFLILLFLCSPANFISEINVCFFNFIEKFAFCVILGVFSNGVILYPNPKLAKLRDSRGETLNYSINVPSKRFCPQFMFIFFAFML